MHDSFQDGARDLDDPAMQDLLDNLLTSHGIPGAVIGILTPEGVARWSSGVLGLRTRVPATVDSVFKVGSISKVYTATLVMILAGQGRIDLDRPVADQMTGLRLRDEAAQHTITPRHLLTHTSGIDGDFYADTGRGDDSLARYVELLASVSQLHRPGETLSYCNAGFNLAGHLVSHVTGQTWERSLHDLLLAPAGLESTVTLAEEAVLHRVAVGHLPGHEGLRQTRTWSVPRASGPSATVAATVDDLLDFARMHLDDGMTRGGRRLLPAELVRAMQAEHAAVPALGMDVDSWGLGWWRTHWTGTPVLGHDGASSGQRAFLRVLPTHGVAVAVLTNGGRGNRLAHEAMTRLLHGATGLRVPEPFAPDEVAATDAFAELVGTYRRDSEITEVRLDTERRLRMTVTWVGALLDGEDDDDLREEYLLLPVPSDSSTRSAQIRLLAARPSPNGGAPAPNSGPAESITFYRLRDGQQVLHFRMRANLRVPEESLFGGTNSGR